MPIEVIEENKSVAQIRIRCDTCGAYIGTRIVLQSELAQKIKIANLCMQCRKKCETETQT
jgi:hypothetical protein